MNTDKNIQLEKFKNIDINDHFFKSLCANYSEFPSWFNRKSEEYAYIMKGDHGDIQAFLYLKEENGSVDDIIPPLPSDRYLKVGTMKINAHGTKLGERFIKKIFDRALSDDITKIYVTVFSKHNSLITLLKRFGFNKYGVKNSNNGTEDVLLKDMRVHTGKVESDYPLVNTNHRQYLLAIYPEYHTRLFPDSILVREDARIIDDVSHTNSISKIYICKMPRVKNIKRGDALVIYRTTDKKGPAEYRSVATSLCMVEDIKNKEDFSDRNDFLGYCESRSVFSVDELTEFFNVWKNLYVIKMTYNCALHPRIIRKRLIEEVGMPRNNYWGFADISKSQFINIATIGGFSESVIVD